MRGTERRFGARLARVCGGLAIASIGMALAGCGGSNTAGTRQESAVTRPATTASSSRTPVRQATTTTRPQTQQATQPAATAQANPAPAATTTAPAPATAPRGEWRPAWWIASPVQENGAVKVAAMADDADLLEARRKAVNLGLSDLRSLVEAQDGALLDAETTIDVISLPDGRYRAFVLVEAK